MNKAPKTFSNSISTSLATAKKDSMGIGRGKSESGSSKLGAPATATSKGAQPPKASVSTGRILPRPAVSSKPLLNSSTTARVQSTLSSTSSNSSNGLSGAPPKSLTGRRNPGGSSNAVTGPSGSIPKALSRAAFRNKPAPTLSPRLRSKVSASVSPSSSISEWSSVSSSSSSMVIQKFNKSRASIDTSSSRSTDGTAMLLHSRSLSSNQTSGGHQNQEVNLANNIPKKPSASGTTGTSVRPSGLRLPSPKIGFFDGVKSSPRTPNGHKPAQSGLRTVLPRNGAAASSPSQMSSGKMKGTKAPTTRMLSKPGHPKVASLTSSEEKFHASINSSSASLDVKDSPSFSLDVKVNATTQEASPKAEKAQVDGVKQVVDAGPASIDKGNLGDLNTHDFTVTEDIEAPVESNEVTGLEVVGQNDVLFIQNSVVKQAEDAGKKAIDESNVDDFKTHEFTVIEGIKASVGSYDFSVLEGMGEMDVLLIQNGVEKQAVDAAMVDSDKGNLGDLNTRDFMVTRFQSSKVTGLEATNNEKLGDLNIQGSMMIGDFQASVESSKVACLEGEGQKDVLLIQTGAENPAADAGMVAIDKRNLGELNAHDFMVTGDIKGSVKSSNTSGLEGVGDKGLLLIQNGVEKQAVDSGTVAIDTEDLGDSNIRDVMMIEDFQASVESNKVTGLEGDSQKEVLLVQNDAEKQANDNGNICDLTTHHVTVTTDIKASVESSKVSCLEGVGKKGLLIIQNGVEMQAIDASTVAIDKEALGDSTLHDVLMIGDFQASVESSQITGLGGDGQKDVLLIQNSVVKQAVDAAGTVAINKENLGDSNMHDATMIGDFQASVESSKVSVSECGIEKDAMAIQNGLENYSPQTCDATGKENTHVKCQIEEGMKECKNFRSPKNEPTCDEYDTNRSPLALVNQVCIDGSREFDALIGDTTSERELE